MENVIIEGDCLRVLRTMPKESVDLIYLDPPFFSKKDYDMPFDDKKSIKMFQDSVRAYEKMDIGAINKSLNIQLIHSENDFWKRDKAGLLRYLAYMKDRLKECYRILKSTGSIYLHCDYHAGHYLKVIMDEIFEYKNYRREITYNTSRNISGFKSKANNWIRQSESIFYYVKDIKQNYTFNKQFTDWNKKQFLEFKYKDNKCRVYKQYKKKGKIIKQYLDKNPGIPIGNIWNDIDTFQFSYLAKRESLGYPTQKPEALLDRIIKASSNKGDLVLDPFCGCGTTLAVAKKLKRNFIGIDISPQACKVMKERLRKRNGVNVPIIKTEYDLSDVNKMSWFEFQQWACDKLKAVPGGKGADRGVDGEGEIKEKLEIIPFLVQVKKWRSNVGDDRVRAFKGAMDNKETPYGIIVANKFSPQAVKQSNNYFKKKQATILLITTKELLKKDFDVKYRTKWNIVAPNYAPWRKKDADLYEYEKCK